MVDVLPMLSKSIGYYCCGASYAGLAPPMKSKAKEGCWAVAVAVVEAAGSLLALPISNKSTACWGTGIGTC